MAQGKSGRVVVDLDPQFKEKLHETLKQRGTTLKQWFLEQAETYCELNESRPITAPPVEKTSIPVNN
jgi:hypothetical protein